MHQDGSRYTVPMIWLVGRAYGVSVVNDMPNKRAEPCVITINGTPQCPNNPWNSRYGWPHGKGLGNITGLEGWRGLSIGQIWTISIAAVNAHSSPIDDKVSNDQLATGNWQLGFVSGIGLILGQRWSSIMCSQCRVRFQIPDVSQILRSTKPKFN